MNKAKLKSYAPQARKDFIAAVSARANQMGISEQSVSAAERHGDILIIDGREWPAAIEPQRDRLIQRINKLGFNQTMEAVAYTWFNRIAALRYMEIHDYLGHGHRVLSSSDGGLPEVLRHASDLGLPGLNAAKVQEMQLAGNRDGELYKMVLVAQCNALSATMPFLFERIDDETELLLPDSLLRTDSIITKLIEAIPEEDWAEVEIIGWLYQFYISEKKEQVIGKVVKSEDIPAATQLFTPNWIVKYLVQNSVGRLWMMANPTSTLKSQWPYYIEPAEQTAEVNAQLDALIQTRMAEDGGSLNPETITVLDPACGSGHILVEAYELLKGIYLERGYQPRSIPRLILEKNLYGLDIDDRAAQMAGFALLMKARADDRRLFNDPPRLNVLSLQESKGLDLDELATHLTPFGVEGATIKALLDSFEHAKTFGSLIQISDALNAQLPALAKVLEKADETGDLYAQAAAQDLLPLVEQAKILAMKFDAVVANPPYMGGKGMNPFLKDYARSFFPDSKSDLFAMFIERGFGWCKPSGFNSMVTMQSWMFLSSYEVLRAKFLGDKSLLAMVHMGNGVMGIAFGTAATVFMNRHIGGYEASFSSCESENINTEGVPSSFPVINDRLKTARPDDFLKIPGGPVAYWVTKTLRDTFELFPRLKETGDTRQGMATSDNGRFLRLWHEVNRNTFLSDCKSREDAKKTNPTWVPYNKGGDFRKWWGNQDFVLNWKNDGEAVIGYAASLYGSPTRTIKSLSEYFKPSVSWSKISSGDIAFRFYPEGFVFDVAGCSIFFENKKDLALCLGFLNSVVAKQILKATSPTINYEAGHIAALPFLARKLEKSSEITKTIESLVNLARSDWDSSEVSWNFQNLSWLGAGLSLASAWESWSVKSDSTRQTVRMLEEQNNQHFIDAYRLNEELIASVPDEQISLARANREKDCQRLVSYAIGCMMGRYSLDESGLIYANAGNVGFDATRYKTFPADADGIVPLTDELWFEDDAANRVREFLLAVWGADTLEENMIWLAESLGRKANETPEEAIRRYVSGSFFKDHLQTYKKRPIYWLFSSGKQGAFQCLVYLHRYHEGTLSRMRAEYVVPLTAKIATRIDLMINDAEATSSAAARTKINKQIEVLRKKQTELLTFDEKLRHYADMRIKLDLDDGVKVNYSKFGDLLDSVKAVTGGTNED